MLVVGMLAWVVRYALFAIGAPDEIRWMIILGVVLHGICYDFFFVTGQIYTDKKAPQPIRAQAQGLLVMLTLGLGMMIGAQVAGEVEAANTPETAIKLNEQVVEKTKELAQLEESIATGDAEQSQVDQVSKEKSDLRHQALASMQWKSLWAFPAIFAAVILVIFVFAFQDKSSGDSSAEST